MRYHLNTLGQFQSDQYPEMRSDEIVLSFRDPAAMEALHAFADLTDDDALAVVTVKRLDAIAEELMRQPELAAFLGGCKATCVRQAMGLECSLGVL